MVVNVALGGWGTMGSGEPDYLPEPMVPQPPRAGLTTIWQTPLGFWLIPPPLQSGINHHLADPSGAVFFFFLFETLALQTKKTAPGP